jgi:tetratricopeptide (TPR) repeat protein
MGFRLYKSVSLGKGVRLNLSKTGVGVSAGIPGLRYSVHSSGRRTKTVGLPGTGVYYRKDSYAGRRSAESRSPAAPPPPTMYPKAGLFAPKDEKEFVKGVTAYMQGDHRGALDRFYASMTRDTAGQHVAEEYFAAFCLVALEDFETAIDMLERITASPVALPDHLMQKHGVGGWAQVSVTPEVVAEVPYSNLSAALLLAELYQEAGDRQKAIELLESLGAVTPDSIFGLSLAELHAAGDAWDDLLRVTEGFPKNEDDATCQLLTYRAMGLREKGLHEAALEVLKESLKSKKRDAVILNQARYQRVLVYEALGRKGRARQDLERIFATDPNFGDVQQRLHLRKVEEQ